MDLDIGQVTRGHTSGSVCGAVDVCAACTSTRTTHSCFALDMCRVSVVSENCLDYTSLNATVCSIMHMCL